jgi:hypothetical protein
MRRSALCQLVVAAPLTIPLFRVPSILGTTHSAPNTFWRRELDSLCLRARWKQRGIQDEERCQSGHPPDG